MGDRYSDEGFFMDKTKDLWVITDKDDLVRIDKTTLQASTFLNRVSLIGDTTDQVYDLGVLDGNLYLFYRSGLLICYAMESQKEIYRQKLSDELPEGVYGNTSYVVPGTNTFYQLCNGNRGGVMLAYDVERRKWNIVLQTSYWLNYLSVDKDGSIWISCHKGLWNIDAGLERKQYIPTLKLVDGRNINTEVSTLYNDSQGGMWVGTLNRGILYYHPDRFRFQNIGRTLFPVTENMNLYVTCIAAQNQENMWVGTRKGLFSYHLSNGDINLYSKELSTVNCNTLFKDSRQRTWLGSVGQGLYCMLPDGETRHYPLSGQTIHSIMEQPDGTLYLCTENQGFGIFTPETGQYEKEQGLPQTENLTVYQLASLGKDRLAGITRKGWFVYDCTQKNIPLTPVFMCVLPSL